MLVLSRQRDETIMIGDAVEITIVDIRGDRVRLGITAPREIQVHRKEVYEAIKRENAEATGVDAGDLSAANVQLRRQGRELGSPGGNGHGNGRRVGPSVRDAAPNGRE